MGNTLYGSNSASTNNVVPDDNITHKDEKAADDKTDVTNNDNISNAISSENTDDKNPSYNFITANGVNFDESRDEKVNGFRAYHYVARASDYYPECMDDNFHRFTTCRPLLVERKKEIESDGKTEMTLRDVTKTHILPMDYSEKPYVQMLESIVMSGWHESKELGTVSIWINELQAMINCLYWDLKLEIKGEYKDEHLTKFEFESNGVILDSYKRKRYESGDIISLRFFTQNIRTPISNRYGLGVLIHDVPPGVSVRLIARKIIVDKLVYDIYKKDILFSAVQHKEFVIPSDRFKIGSGASACIEEYGITSDEGNIEDLLKSIDDVPFNILASMYEVKNNVLWVKLRAPFPVNRLEFNIKRKKEAELRFIAKVNNWILKSYCTMVNRYCYSYQIIDLSKEDPKINQADQSNSSINYVV